MIETRFRIGVVGCGTISRNVHLPVLLALPEVQVAWVADRNVTVGSALARDAGVPFHALDPSRVELPPTDIVVLAVPNGARPAYYDYLARQPEVGVYVEKPFARSVEEHLEIASARTPSHTAVGLDRRSFGITRLARQVFERRLFGAPLSMRVEFGGLGVVVGDTFMADAALAGGGRLYQMGVHFIDAVLYACDARDVSLHGGRLMAHRELDVHVEAELAVTLPDESIVPFNVTVTHLQRVSNRIQIEFERASVGFSIMYGEHALHVEPRGGASSWALAPSPETGPLDLFASFGLHWRNAITAYRTGVENYTSAGTTLLTSKAIELLYSIPAETIHG
jgi:predicted dehydrogenase